MFEDIKASFLARKLVRQYRECKAMQDQLRAVGTFEADLLGIGGSHTLPALAAAFQAFETTYTELEQRGYHPANLITHIDMKDAMKWVKRMK